MSAPSAHTHEDMGWCKEKWPTSEHKDEHVTCVCPYSQIYRFFCMRLLWICLHSVHTSPIGLEVGEWSSAQWTPVWKPWDAVLAQSPFDSLLGCEKSSSVKCGCNSVHIALSWFKTSLKFLSSDSKVCCCSSAESNAVSPVAVVPLDSFWEHLLSESQTQLSRFL